MSSLPAAETPIWRTATCHCGRVSVAIPRKPDEINECRCSLCYAYGALWAYYPRHQVTVTTTTAGIINGSEDASIDTGSRKYIRTDKDGTGNLSFNYCTHCGVMTHWWEEPRNTDPDRLMGVNMRIAGEDAIEGVAREVNYE
ncbi:hypothetical protein B0T19DRAFT_446536 [Cercophora scortea]|uniref:CENP-V/GFA domain-containing protein n=1 Tax=Cercophora scortea TaxID=314031 RepID=A0AAE0I2V5_9PEZI|nr:hypothetical protein B0T19DRAFT_446536 [Cercophora scortea]